MKGTRAVAARQASSPRRPGDAGGAEDPVATLRTRWRAASLAAGWPFPSDWGLPEVDDVCAAVASGADLPAVLAVLGRARARSGAGLDETLVDLAALHAVLTGGPGSEVAISGGSEPATAADWPAATDGSPTLPEVVNPNATPAFLLRATALAWADTVLGELRSATATESLTGLATSDYLRVRLGEVYREGARAGRCPSSRFVLLVVTLDLSAVVGWARLMAMVLTAETLRRVFDGGESLAVLGPSVAVVLTERGRDLAERAARARGLVVDRFGVDPRLRPAGRPDFRVERLPETEAGANDLINSVCRA